MTSYEFTLTVDGDATACTDELFEVAEGDLVPEGGGQEPSVVHALRDTDTLAAAIFDAVHVVESVGLTVTGISSNDLVSLKDIASRTGRSYESVRLLAAGRRGPGGFPALESSETWALYSWTLAAAWFAKHYGGRGADDYDRKIAAADHILRARHMLSDDYHRAEMAQLAAA